MPGKRVDDVLKANMATVWVQPEGPGTAVYMLACVEAGDLATPRGDVTSRYCPDPTQPDKYVVMTRERGVPDRATFSLTEYVGPTRSWLERMANDDCAVPVYIVQNRCNRADSFLDYDRGRVMPYSVITSGTESNSLMRESGETTEEAFEFSADLSAKFWAMRETPIRRTTTEDEPLNDIAIAQNSRCPGACGPFAEVCDRLVAVGDSTGAAAADIWVSTDGGVTWAAAAAQPFGITNDLVSVVAFPIMPSTWRILVVRDTLAATPLQVAYSDDWGVSWTVVNVGATAIEAAQWNGALFALDAHHIWCVADAGAAGTGSIYFSNDGGLSWTAQTAATADALNYVRFLNNNMGVVVGDTDEIMYTTDGGTTWQAPAVLGAAAGNDILCVEVLSRYRWIIGYDDGTLYQTLDGGATWTQMQFNAVSGATVEAINDIYFIDEFHGVMILEFDNAAAAERSSIFVTHNGGANWERYDCGVTFATNGLFAAVMCDQTKVIAVGDTVGGTAAIYEVSAA